MHYTEYFNFEKHNNMAMLNSEIPKYFQVNKVFKVIKSNRVIK